MGIQFGEIHNLVRTYHRLLHLPAEGPDKPSQPEERAADRISISREARERLRGPETGGAEPARSRAGAGDPT